MKVLILAGGYGTRLSEETDMKPKPMVTIGQMPILWHIMKHYSSHGFNEFVILLGYRGYYIKEFFSNYFLHSNDVTIDLKKNDIIFHNNESEPWKITLLDTGLDTMTGGRIKRVSKYVNNERFLLTYGDGLSNINIKELVSFHEDKEKLLTMTAVQPIGRYGAISIDNDLVESFIEKPRENGSWINGGFFVCEPNIFDYIEGDNTIFEEDPIRNLVMDHQVAAFQHKGFWGCMDTLRDKHLLNQMWEKNEAPWKNWSK